MTWAVWRNALIIVTSLFAVPVTWPVREPSMTDRPAADAITCHGADGHTGWLYRTLFGREPDADGLTYWVGQRLDGYASWQTLVRNEGRQRVARTMAQPDDLAAVWPKREAPMCTTVRRLGLTEIRPGLAVGRDASTITVIGDRRATSFRAIDGPRRHASDVPGDVVVNANWFTASGPQAPVVTDGRLTGSADNAERGQLVVRRPGCDPAGSPSELDHVWMGEIFRHDVCIVAAVSGISLVHKGVRADAYPGIDITTGYTNTSRSHSFIGFNDTDIVLIATWDKTAAELADYAISLGVTEGVMLDGGGSTQIDTPTDDRPSARAVPAFAVLNSTY